MIFVTTSGTEYTLDEVNKVFIGGRYKKPTPYLYASAMIGCRGEIVLTDNSVVSTSIVRGYDSVSRMC